MLEIMDFVPEYATVAHFFYFNGKPTGNNVGNAVKWQNLRGVDWLTVSFRQPFVVTPRYTDVTDFSTYVIPCIIAGSFTSHANNTAQPVIPSSFYTLYRMNEYPTEFNDYWDITEFNNHGLPSKVKISAIGFHFADTDTVGNARVVQGGCSIIFPSVLTIDEIYSTYA